MPAEPNQTPAPCPNSVVASDLRVTRRLSRRRPAGAKPCGHSRPMPGVSPGGCPSPGPAWSIRAPSPSPPLDPSTLGPSGSRRQALARRAPGPTRYSITDCELWGLRKSLSVSCGERLPISRTPVDASRRGAGDHAVARMSQSCHVSQGHGFTLREVRNAGRAVTRGQPRLCPIPSKASPNRGAATRIATIDRLDRGRGPRHSPRAMGTAPR
jgi:hypothetical protein